LPSRARSPFSRPRLRHLPKVNTISANSCKRAPPYQAPAALLVPSTTTIPNRPLNHPLLLGSPSQQSLDNPLHQATFNHQVHTSIGHLLASARTLRPLHPQHILRLLNACLVRIAFTGRQLPKPITTRILELLPATAGNTVSLLARRHAYLPSQATPIVREQLLVPTPGLRLRFSTWSLTQNPP
jgi:hypothetical protein